jgi:hypothetical protein
VVSAHLAVDSLTDVVGSKGENTDNERMLSALYPIATAKAEVEFGFKQSRRIAARYDKLAANDLAFIQLESAYGSALMSPRPISAVRE